MSNKKQSPFEKFDWSDIQKKYVDALNAFNTPKPSMESVWVNAMDDWWKSAKPKSEFEGTNIFEKVLDQCRNYYYMSEQFSNLVEGINKLKSNNENITAFINGKFKDIDSSFFDGSNIFNWNSLAENYAPPNDFMKSAFLDPSAFSNSMPHGSIPGISSIADQFLSSPGLGYSREAQDKAKHAIKLWTDYQQNYQEYQSVMAGLNQDALELMRKRILEMSTNGEDISSIRQMYDLWVDSNEKVYAEYVYTEEYAELNGRLVNSMMAFKKQSQAITEDALSSMNLPTTSSVDELARRHYELRKQMKAMQTEINSLKKQLQQKSNKSEVVKKQEKPTTKRKKKVKKTVASNAASNVIEIKQTKKKPAGNSKSDGKKEKQESRKSSADKGMIELKF
jgi:class III poly(R)-hydroxyalkanoic acid synthase PhaE subunit